MFTLVACAAAVALVALFATRNRLPSSVGNIVTITSLVVTVALATVIKTPLRIRSTTLAFAWVETAIVIGLAVAPPSWVILVTGIGVACGSVTRLAPIKTAFAVAKHTLVAGGATVVVLLMGDSWPPRDPLGIVLLLGIVYLVAALLDDVLAIPVIALASGTPISRQFRNDLDLRVAGFALRFLVAACTVLILRADPRLLLAVPPLVLSLHLAYSTRIRTRTEQHAWQRLARATDALNVVDLDQVLTTAVTEAAELFSADEVEIELRDGGRVVRGSAEALTYDGTGEESSDVTGMVIPNSGHWLYQEHPAELTRILLQFLR